MGAAAASAWPLIVGMIGSSAASGIFAPEGQEIATMEGEEGIDPGQLLGESKGLMSDYLTAILDSVSKGTELETRAPDLPSYVGGALPMAIAAPARDAGSSPTPGFSMKRRTLSEHDGSIGGGADRIPPPRGPAVPRPGAPTPPTSPDPEEPGQRWPNPAQPRIDTMSGQGSPVASANPDAVADVLSLLMEQESVPLARRRVS